MVLFETLFFSHANRVFYLWEMCLEKWQKYFRLLASVQWNLCPSWKNVPFHISYLNNTTKSAIRYLVEWLWNVERSFSEREAKIKSYDKTPRFLIAHISVEDYRRHVSKLDIRDTQHACCHEVIEGSTDNKSRFQKISISPP